MKNLLLLLFIFPVVVSAQEKADMLIINGRILDGTGNSWYYGDVAVKDGKILAVGKLNNYAAAKIIDAGNRIIAPGFIDVHTHIEGDEVRNPTADNFIYDGVTTVVTGNCGYSRPDLQKYFRLIDSVKTSVNIASLIGHNEVREDVMGAANRDPNEEELQRMEALVEKAMKDGAVGLSTGLIYTPGTYSKTPEIIRLAKVAARYNGLYVSHIRDESDGITQAFEEAFTIGREAKLPVQISHFKVMGRPNWGRSEEAVSIIAAARKEGIDVTIDQYPYTAGSTGLSFLLPDKFLADGSDSVKARLQRPDVKKQVIDGMLKLLKKAKLKHYSHAVVANYSADTTLNGKSIEQINLLKGRKHNARQEAETVIEMMLQGGASMIYHFMSEEDVKRIMQYPFNMIASDGGIRVFNQGVPHPRSYGTNARVLSKYVREEKVLTLEEAIRRMTSLPAQKFQLKDRGLIREGMAADIVVFDEKEVKDHATYDRPHQYSTGFHYVIVNGQLVIDNGKHTGIRSGKTLTGPGYSVN